MVLDQRVSHPQRAESGIRDKSTQHNDEHGHNVVVIDQLDEDILKDYLQKAFSQ